MTPDTMIDASQQTYMYRQPSLTYKLNEKNIAGKISNMESVKQAIYHILSTERYSNPIYDDSYGIELEQYIGKDIGFIKAGIESTIREALLQDDRITGVIVDSISKSDVQENSCVITLTVSTIYGEVNTNFNIA